MSSQANDGATCGPAFAENEPVKHAACEVCADGLDRPNRRQAADALEQARRMYQRSLACWACDALVMRKSGLDEATWRIGQADSEWDADPLYGEMAA